MAEPVWLGMPMRAALVVAYHTTSRPQRLPFANTKFSAGEFQMHPIYLDERAAVRKKRAALAAMPTSPRTSVEPERLAAAHEWLKVARGESQLCNGSPCLKCGGKLEREHDPDWETEHYWFLWWFVCAGCGTLWLDERAKVRRLSSDSAAIDAEAARIACSSSIERMGSDAQLGIEPRWFTAEEWADGSAQRGEVNDVA